jgi:hypothetical protein
MLVAGSVVLGLVWASCTVQIPARLMLVLAATALISSRVHFGL